MTHFALGTGRVRNGLDDQSTKEGSTDGKAAVYQEAFGYKIVALAALSQP